MIITIKNGPITEVPQEMLSEIKRENICVSAGPKKAVEFLDRAHDLMEQRGRQYDSPEGERSMEKIVAIFNLYTGQNLTEAEGYLFMQTLKDVRQWQKPDYHADSAEDCIAYAALKAEALVKGAKK